MGLSVLIAALYTSLVTKKYLLLMVAMGVLVADGWTKSLSRATSLYFLLFGWMLVGAVFENFPSAKDIDWGRNFAYGVCLVVVLDWIFRRSELEVVHRKITTYGLISGIIMYASLLLYGGGHGLNVYEAFVNGGKYLSFGYDELSVVLGIALISLVLQFQNAIEKEKIIMLLVLVLLILLTGKRSCVVFVVGILATFFISGKISYGKVAIMLSAVVGLVISSIITAEDSKNYTERIFKESFGAENEEGRIGLVLDFFENIAKIKIFGPVGNISEYNIEGNVSFHNIVLDSAWVGGYILAIISIAALIVMTFFAAKTRNKIVRFVGLFGVGGLLLGAPSISNIFALAYCISMMNLFRRS